MPLIRGIKKLKFSGGVTDKGRGEVEVNVPQASTDLTDVADGLERANGDILYDNGVDTWVRGDITDIGGTVAIDKGGTGATTAPSARDNLDLGTSDAVSFNKLSAAGGMDVDATSLIRLDGSVGHTYITESGPDVLDIYVGGDNVMKIDEATGKLSFPVGIKEVHSGYHGNVLRSKILPSDFSTDSSRALIFDATTGGIKLGIAAADMWATVPIPTGYKATKVKLFGNNTRAFEVFETEIDLATKTSKGSGAVGTELDITDVDSTKDNFLVIQVALVATSEIIYGGYVTIAVI